MSKEYSIYSRGPLPQVMDTVTAQRRNPASYFSFLPRDVVDSVLALYLPRDYAFPSERVLTFKNSNAVADTPSTSFPLVVQSVASRALSIFSKLPEVDKANSYIAVLKLQMDMDALRVHLIQTRVPQLSMTLGEWMELSSRRYFVVTDDDSISFAKDVKLLAEETFRLTSKLKDIHSKFLFHYKIYQNSPDRDVIDFHKKNMLLSRRFLEKLSEFDSYLKYVSFNTPFHCLNSLELISKVSNGLKTTELERWLLANKP